MARRVGNSNGLRALLIAEAVEFERRWRIPGKPYERLVALRAGEAVTVDAAGLLCALIHAGLPHADYAYGGRYRDSVFVFDENDQIRELVAE